MVTCMSVLADHRLPSQHAAAVLQCIQYVDGDTLQELVPRLVDLLKSAVGLSTKTGCADVIVQLSTHCSRDLEPFAGKLLLALLNGLNDRNLTVKKRYASTIGHVVKVRVTSTLLLYSISGLHINSIVWPTPISSKLKLH